MLNGLIIGFGVGVTVGWFLYKKIIKVGLIQLEKEGKITIKR